MIHALTRAAFLRRANNIRDGNVAGTFSGHRRPLYRPFGLHGRARLCSARRPVPAEYKEAGRKVGEPLDAIDRGAWWSVYKDPLLDDLERQIDISNQTANRLRSRANLRSPSRSAVGGYAVSVKAEPIEENKNLVLFSLQPAAGNNRAATLRSRVA
jgi:hypothetical protein